MLLFEICIHPMPGVPPHSPREPSEASPHGLSVTASGFWKGGRDSCLSPYHLVFPEFRSLSEVNESLLEHKMKCTKGKSLRAKMLKRKRTPTHPLGRDERLPPEREGPWDIRGAMPQGQVPGGTGRWMVCVGGGKAFMPAGLLTLSGPTPSHHQVSVQMPPSRRGPRPISYKGVLRCPLP